MTTLTPFSTRPLPSFRLCRTCPVLREDRCLLLNLSGRLSLLVTPRVMVVMCLVRGLGLLVTAKGCLSIRTLGLQLLIRQ